MAVTITLRILNDGSVAVNPMRHVIQDSSVSLTARSNLNFDSPLVATDDSGSNQSDITLDDSLVDHANILNTGVNTHAQIDTHIVSLNNPHNTSITEAITADGGTDILTSELEILSDGSNADTLHSHSGIVSNDLPKALYEALSNRFYVFSDFADTLGGKKSSPFQAITAGAGAIIAGSISTDVNHPGIWRMLTGSTSAGRVFILSISGGVIVGTVELGGGVTRIGSWIRVGANLSTALERYTIRVGLFSIALPNVILEGIGFEYDDSQNGGRWQLVTHDGNETSIDSGITVSATTWYKLETEINAVGTSVEFFVNNISVGISTTNIPTGTAFDLFYNTHIMKLTGTTFREMEIDAAYMYQEITR